MRRCSKHGKGVLLNTADRISELPEALLLQILSSLPTKVVVATSVLSKRWKSIWTMVSKLVFFIQSKHERYSEDVCKVLLSNKAPFLEILCLHLCVHYDAMDIGMWIGIAYARHVRELELYGVRSRDLKLPKSFYNCETLKTLKLKAYVLIDIPSPVSLKSLRTLHLVCVDYKDDASVVNLLSGCPNLENLVVKRHLPDHVRTFTIEVPSLQRLEIDDWHCGVKEEIGDYVINAPCLKYLKFKGIHIVKFRLVEIAPELVEANIIHEFLKGTNEKLMRSLTSIKRLSLSKSLSEITFPRTTSSIFHQLVYLELITDKTEWWNLFTLMINTCPRLQVLKLTRQCFQGDFVFTKWNQPKNVPECLSHHLETFVWNGLKKPLQHEKEVTKYIIRNASRLKKVHISIKGFDSEDKRLELLEELENLVKASNSSCQLLLY